MRAHSQPHTQCRAVTGRPRRHDHDAAALQEFERGLAGNKKTEEEEDEEEIGAGSGERKTETERESAQGTLAGIDNGSGSGSG